MILCAFVVQDPRRAARDLYWGAGVRVLVVEGLAAFPGDLALDLGAAHLRLAAQARHRADVEGLVEDVFLALLDVRERIEALLHPQVTRRAGQVAAAG